MLDDVSPRTRPMAFSRSKRTAVLIHSASLSSNNRLTLVCDNSVSRQRPRSLGWAINSVRGVHNEKKKKKSNRNQPMSMRIRVDPRVDFIEYRHEAFARS